MSHSFHKMESQDKVLQKNLRYFVHQETHLKYVVYVTCSMTILGSLLIILTYLLFRELRTRVRLILFHLSIMDLGVGLSNLIGTAIDFNGYYQRNYTEWAAPRYIHALCSTQAGFAMYSTYGSVFWTNCLAVYLYFAVVRCSDKTKRILLWVSVVLCYVLPLVLSLWLVLTHKLGPSPYGSGGWCSLINVDPSTGTKEYFSITFGYDMWIYLTFVLVPLLYIGTRVHISIEVYTVALDYWL